MNKALILALTALVGYNATTIAQTRFVRDGQPAVSSAHCLYVNDALKSRPGRYTFRTVNEALLFVQANDSKDTLWTDICIEPSVYWIDNPDDPTDRTAPKGESPFGLKVQMNRVRMIGLSTDPRDVVLACNRGQTQGSVGNFTMLGIEGSDIEAHNITFGNYCNIDLVYPRNPRLNRPKRNPAIVQAQLVICHGDRYRIRNCQFLSRLNLCPFVGPDHVDFQDCYFESTDDALCGTGTYRHCRLTFYDRKPFYATSRQGATFIDCDLHSKVRGVQYITKASSPVQFHDCRFTSDDPDLRIEWTTDPDPRHHCEMTGCTLNGRPYCVPTTPMVPMPVSYLNLGLANQPDIIPGQWTLDCYKPSDTQQYNWHNTYTDAHLAAQGREHAAWSYAEGVDGAVGCFGLTQNIRGARLMYTGRDGEEYQGQELRLNLDPCKERGQGFASATGQYMDVCIKFDTRTLTGYGLRFVRTPNHDNAVDVYFVEYQQGQITALSPAQTCYCFRRGCQLTLTAQGSELRAVIDNPEFISQYPDLQTQPLQLTTSMPHPNLYGGIHIQHTGSLGPSGTIISNIKSRYLE